MPISAIDGCSAEHWSEVKAIITEAVEICPSPKIKVRLVSEADDVGVIQKRIVQNVYNSDIVICDVSGKNPNVMFELGMRLAFDKATVLIKDDKTDYTFDTGIIEHIAYPRDLRYSRMVTFRAALLEKVLGTYKASKAVANYSMFLKNFGTFHVAKLTETPVTPDALLAESLVELQAEVRRLGNYVVRQQDAGESSARHLWRAAGQVPSENVVALASRIRPYVNKILKKGGSFTLDQIVKEVSKHSPIDMETVTSATWRAAVNHCLMYPDEVSVE